jgi:hypothetical protein
VVSFKAKVSGLGLSRPKVMAMGGACWIGVVEGGAVHSSSISVFLRVLG